MASHRHSAVRKAYRRGLKDVSGIAAADQGTGTRYHKPAISATGGSRCQTPKCCTILRPAYTPSPVPTTLRKNAVMTPTKAPAHQPAYPPTMDPTIAIIAAPRRSNLRWILRPRLTAVSMPTERPDLDARVSPFVVVAGTLNPEGVARCQLCCGR